MNTHLLSPLTIEEILASGARLEIIRLAENLVVRFLDWGHTRMSISHQDYLEWRRYIERLNQQAWTEEIVNPPKH